MDMSVTRFFKSCGHSFSAVVGRGKEVVVAVSAATTAVAAHAAPDYSGITGAIDWSTALTAVGAVFTGVVSVYMLIKGGKIILGVVKGG